MVTVSTAPEVCDHGAMAFWFKRKTRVGVYVDAFNVYYGARDHCGRGKPGWRWLDLVGLGESIARDRMGQRTRVVSLDYCTALRVKEGDSSSARDQTLYMNALQIDPRVRVELGQYNVKNGKGVLIGPPDRKRAPKRVVSPGVDHIPSWLPADEVVGPEGDMNLLVRFSSFEEKGSDVNVATRLLVDVLSRRVDCALVLSNDGDLSLPLRIARQHVPVGLINPTKRPLSQMLKGEATEGVGRHWWQRLTADDYRRHQLPPVTGGFAKPEDW